jgi:hypothetical protein
MSELTDRLIKNVEDSEVAEVAIVLVFSVYLVASRVGYLLQSAELDMIAIMVIGAVVGLDTLYKKVKRRRE